ncbi:cytochrome P450 [Nocardia bovistercoris]|uniref:Cytochrome P450 n=1 Tax=Nocardia bovistercoris TaxID=2785916 RepID=A0A931N7D6_9NOCA|nr:cytochrome P450 [Nocardia bovistercoris]MBH0781672.1 cytochrome P450 [Nocardia bovistercoris]
MTASRTHVPENARFVEMPNKLLDRAVRRIPQRRGVLAPPPPGSGLRPVPGYKGLPWLGDSIQALHYGSAYTLDLVDRFGKMVWTRGFGRDMVLAAGGEAIDSVLSNRDRAFVTGQKDLIDPFFHGGLLLLDFEEHRMDRRVMQQAFSPQRLRGYFARVSELAGERIGRWGSAPMKLYPSIKQLSMDIAADVFMGVELGPRADRLAAAFEAMLLACESPLRFPVPGGRWHGGLRGRRELERYFAEMLPAKRVDDGADFFSVLCRIESQDGHRFGDEKVIDHMIFLLLAAHDTSTTTATVAAYFLGKHPEWQRRAREESLALGADAPDVAALDSLTALDLVIKESMRLVAPVPFIMRKAVADTDIAGYFVPAGTNVLLGAVANHYLPEYWTDPWKFDPDRFGPERREDRSHRYAWMPFGAGVHKCIGMYFATYEVKAMLHAMLCRYDWDFPAGYEMPWQMSALPFPKDGVPITLRPRR